VPGDDRPDGVRGHAAGGRDAGHLVLGGGRADVRIEAGRRGRDEVDRDRPLPLAWRSWSTEAVIRSIRALLVGPRFEPAEVPS
jgi:hypothetical protein